MELSPQFTDSRARWLNKVAQAAVGHRLAVLGIIAVVCAASAAMLPSMRISTSRHGLVSPNDPYQARLLQFLEEFGYPDAMLITISGGEPTLRRKFIDALTEELKTVPELQDRILARMGPAQVAELLLLQNPGLLLQLQAQLPQGTTFQHVVQEGLSGALQLASHDGSSLSFAEQNELLGLLANAVRALDAYVQGNDPWQSLKANHFTNMPANSWTLDDAGYLVGRRNEHHLMALLARLPSDEVEDVKPVVKQIRDIRDDLLTEHPQFAGLEAQLTGMPALAVDEQQLIHTGLRQSSMAAGLGIFLLLLIAFRSLLHTTMSLVPLAVGTLTTLAVVRLMYGELNLVTSSFVSVLMGLGIDFSVHFVARFNELRRGGLDAAGSAIRALLRAGPGILTGAATTALAFLTTTTTEFTAFAQLGIITSIGLVLMLLATFFVLPATLSIPFLSGRTTRPLAHALRFSYFSRWVQRARWPILLVGVLGGIAGAGQLNSIGFNARYFDFLPQGSESARALEMIESDGSMSPVFVNLSADSLEQARDMAERLREMPTVAAVETVTDLLPALNEENLAQIRDIVNTHGKTLNLSALATAPVNIESIREAVDHMLQKLGHLNMTLSVMGFGNAPIAEAYAAMLSLRDTLEHMTEEGEERLIKAHRDSAKLLGRAWRVLVSVSERGAYAPEDLPPLMQSRFVSKDKERVALFAYPADVIWESTAAERFVRDIESVDPRASGIAFNAYKHPKMIVKGFQRAALLAVILVFLVLLLDFRNTTHALLALTPVTFGWMWMLGLMRIFNIQFDIANIVCLPLVLGIGIDTGVHMVHRVLHSQAQHGGVANLEEVINGTGVAVILAALTTMLGFAALLTADYGAMHSLGKVMVVAISCSLFACLLVLPALLVFLGKAR